MAALAKEVRDLRERQLQDRHESILRDDAIFRRISIQEDRMDIHSEYLKQTMAAVGQAAETITKVGLRIDVLVARID